MVILSKRLLLIFCIQVPVTFLVLTLNAYTQSASATWALTVDTTAIISGNITASPQILSDTMSVRDFIGGDSTSGSPVGAAERIWRNSLYWPEETTENSTRYIQYSVFPTPGYIFTVQSIVLNIGCFGTNGHLFANIYYSTDSTFITRTQLNPTSLTLPDIRTVAMMALSYTPGVTVVDGQKFYLRIYPWYNSTPSPTKYVCLTDVVISGTTVAPGTPTISIFPDTLSFGSVHVGASKEMSYSLSGTNLTPESDSITVTAPAGFEVSTTSGSGYAVSINVQYAGGTLSSTVIYVKFAPDSILEYNRIITNAGGGVAAQNVTVTGEGVAPDVVLGFYVSPDGLDTNPGSYELPFKTIPRAISFAQPGDSIFVRGGRYMLSAKIGISKNGTSISRYYLFAYPGERPVLDFSSMAVGSSNRGVDLSGSYWHIKGLDIYRAGDNGMILSGSNNIIEFCAFYENYDTGLQLSNGASNNRIINCDSYYNADAGQKNADGFAPKLDVGMGNYFYGCRSWQNSDDGWDGYLRPSDNVTTVIENSWCFNNGFLKNGSGSSGNGNGFKMGGGDSSNIQNLRHNMILKNCLSFDNRVKGFDQNNNRGSMTLFNCTAYRNGTDYNITGSLKDGSTLTVINCITFGGQALIGTYAIQQTNSWLSPFNVTAEDFITLDTAGVRGSRKADGSLPERQLLASCYGQFAYRSGNGCRIGI